jgi:uncharacterized protein YndB with AHSA1/START domain
MDTATNTNGKAINSKTTFSTECAVAINIQASAETVWMLLTDAADIPNWNSTVISLEGQIALDKTISLKSTASPERTFKLKVSELTAPSRMVWEDGMAPMFKGVRTYTLTPNTDGTTDFAMREIIDGLMLPLIRSSLPDFRPIFEQFAADLKQAAESVVPQENE